MSFLDDIGEVVGTVAPALATALGGPLAGMATRAIAGKLLGNADASEDELRAAIQTASPEDLVRLKEVEADFKVQLKNAGVKLEEIAAGDRDSARRRQVDMGDWTPTVLGLAIILGFFGILGAIMFVEVPTNAATIINILLGALAAMTAQVGNYFFGSSAGSARKNDTIEKLKALG